MPYVALEDVGTTRRRSLSGRRRLQAWERTGGTCVVCAQRIDGVRERWIVEHIRALELGGADSLENTGPAHEACGREKTRDDHCRAAAAKRQKIRHLGAAVITRPFPGSRASAFKRKIDGTVVPREDPSRLRAADKLKIGHGRVATSTRQPILPAKENKKRTTDQVTKRTTARTREKVNGAQSGDTAPGEIRSAIPIHLDFLFSDRPLLPGEDGDRYKALQRSIVQEVKPVDVIEAIWIKDVIDLIWEATRLRGWRRQILVQAQLSAAEALIRPALHNADPMGVDQFMGASADALTAAWLTGNGGKKDRVDKILQERGFTAENVTAHGFLLNLPSIERIDRLASQADQRRDALLREIERKRASFAQVVRVAHADVLDVARVGTP